jgi:hypothetical protein
MYASKTEFQVQLHLMQKKFYNIGQRVIQDQSNQLIFISKIINLNFCHLLKLWKKARVLLQHKQLTIIKIQMH